jgi:hypothetical protein
MEELTTVLNLSDLSIVTFRVGLGTIHLLCMYVSPLSFVSG